MCRVIELPEKVTMKDQIIGLKLIQPKEQGSDNVILFARFNMVAIPKKKTNKQYNLNVQRECQIIRLVLWHLTIYIFSAPKACKLASLRSCHPKFSFKSQVRGIPLQPELAVGVRKFECRRRTQFVG